MEENPFDVLELDPRSSVKELTEALRRRAERAGEDDREAIQRAWRQITMRERDRVRWAFFAHPRPPESGPGSIPMLREETPTTPVRHKSPPLSLAVSDLMDSDDPSTEVGEIPPRWDLFKEQDK